MRGPGDNIGRRVGTYPAPNGWLTTLMAKERFHFNGPGRPSWRKREPARLHPLLSRYF